MNDILEFIEKTLSMSLKDHVVPSRKRNILNINTAGLASATIRQIEALGIQYAKYGVQPNGYKTIAIIRSTK